MGGMSVSYWSHLELVATEPPWGLMEKAHNDPRTDKVVLSMGLYCDANGDSYVMPAVRKAEQLIMERQMDKEYAGMSGLSDFCQVAMELALGADNPVIVNKTIATVQTVAGAAACRLAAEFLSRHYPYSKTVYLANYTWPNHVNIFRDAGMTVERYRYFSNVQEGIDEAGLYEDLQKMPEKSIVVVQASAHNPTGVDPTLDQWKRISRICKERSHFVVVDLSYQGFASGNLEEDAAGLRQLVADGNQIAIAQTFSKTMGLCGERVGTLAIVCRTPEEVKVVLSNMKLIIRRIYSNPPLHGARIATEILTNPQLKKQWISEFEAEARTVMQKRRNLYNALVKYADPKVDWSYIMRQKGWFSFIGLKPEQIERLEKDYAIFMPLQGHIPVVTIVAKDVDYLAKALNEVMKN